MNGTKTHGRLKPVLALTTLMVGIGAYAYAQNLEVENNGTFGGNVGIGTTTPAQKLHTTGNVRADGRSYYFGGGQRLYGDNGSALHWYNNHSTTTQMLFRDAEGTVYGRVYGSGNGANFGMLDGDGNWSYLASKDNYTDLRINNSTKIRIKLNGNVGIGTTSPSDKLDVNGYIRGSFRHASCTWYCVDSGGGGGKTCPDGKFVAGLRMPDYHNRTGTNNPCGNADDFEMKCCGG